MLLLAYVVAFVDRQILNLLVEPIRRDTGLTDVEISLLQGLSFAIFVSVGGLPIGRLVDTRRRTALLAIGIAGWSLCTGAFGLAGSFAGMLLARIGVGVGEATMTPSAYSLIGDYVSDRRLGLAAAIYGLGPFAGSGLALLLGAAVLRLLPADGFVVPLIGSIHSWQMIFLLLVPVGLLVAIWVASLREPPRRLATPEPPDKAAIKHYFAQHGATIAGVNAATGFGAMATYALLAWAPALLSRRYGLSTAEAGERLGLVLITACCAGVLLAGQLGDVLRRRGHAGGRLIVLGGALLGAIPLAAWVPSAPTANAFLWRATPLYFLLAAAIGSGPATLQEITPNQMRGVQHAIAVLIASLFGLGLGPTAVAVTTEHVLGSSARLGDALMILLPLMLTVALAATLLTIRSYARTLAAVTR
ncbi:MULTISPECIES: MFS transporter [unclassified Sphingomonas]|uniref:MFS transporter n=1 Tax=unclassified Sphingomonas TaxID=196159 RepID=UPI0018E55C65|nr:MFS transporter [Sphingomonas sp. FARSPH]